MIFLVETKATIAEDPRSAAERYENALKEGYVEASLMKVLIIGSAGVGKTHLLRLLFGEPLPEIRNSTAMFERPVQAIQASSDTCTFGRMSDRELYEIMAINVNKHNTRIQSHPLHTAFAQNSSMRQSKLLPSSSYLKSKKMYSAESKKLSCASLFTKQSSCNNNQNIGACSQLPFNSASFHVSEVTEQLIPCITKFKDVSHLNINWVYFIDSGGQPQFHQLISAFMKNTNLNIFVFRLCDRLCDHPLIAFYENGDCLSSSPSMLSNTEILQHCVQATQANDQNGHSRLLIVGTHRDLENNSETKDDKDKILLDLLTPAMKDHLLYSKRDGNKVIFPLNAKEPVEVDRNVVSEITKAVLSMKNDIQSKKIPLRWLVFHQELQSLSKGLSEDILTFQQCFETANILHMSKQDVICALKFFADLNVIFYYDTILPNIVFINPQALLNLISGIVNCITYKTDAYQATDGRVVRACNEGIISVKLFEDLKSKSHSMYKAEFFEPNDLIDLLVHLRLAINLEKNAEYFMPFILSSLNGERIKWELSSTPDTIVPGVVYFKNRWISCGEFPSLVTSLLSSKRWKLAYEGHKMLCVHSNCIKLLYGPCLVTLIDVGSHIEVHVNSDASFIAACAEIKHYLLASMRFEADWAFLCPCTYVAEKHLALQIMVAKTHAWSCCKNPRRTIALSDLGHFPEVWLQKCTIYGELY